MILAADISWAAFAVCVLDVVALWLVIYAGALWIRKRHRRG